MVDKPSAKTWLNQFVLGASEIMYLLGLVFFFIGLWLWIGLGQALFGVGCVLITTGLINAQARDARQETRNAV
jgi:positive regulator of sigma E activity